MGVTESGEAFTLRDDWQQAEHSHRHFEERWTGIITFFFEGGEESKLPTMVVDHGKVKAPLRWADAA